MKNEKMKYRAVNQEQLKIWLENVKKEWQKEPLNCDNYCRYIELKYKGNYNYYCTKSRQLFGDCIKRNGTWYFL